MTNTTNGHIHIGRRELIAKLALIGMRAAARTPGHARADDIATGDTTGLSVSRIAAYVTECGREFDLTNDDQLMFMRLIVCGKTSVEEMLETEDKGEC